MKTEQNVARVSWVSWFAWVLVIVLGFFVFKLTGPSNFEQFKSAKRLNSVQSDSTNLRLAVEEFKTLYKYTFKTDKEKFNRLDVWEVPTTVQGEFSGDSESFHVLLADHLVFAGVPTGSIHFMLLGGTDKCVLYITGKEDFIVNYYEVKTTETSSIQTDDFILGAYDNVRESLFIEEDDVWETFVQID